MSQSMDKEDKLHLSSSEKSFRYRTKFGTEITLYVLIMICSVFLALNHMMSVNRKAKHYKDELKKIQSKPK